MSQLSSTFPFGVYTDSKGHKKPALVLGTHETVDPDNQVPQPAEGYVHLYIFGFRGISFAANVPLRAVAESIPDYTVEGQLVGFFEEA